MMTDERLAEIRTGCHNIFSVPWMVLDLFTEVDRLRAAIRTHRDYRGNDRCYLDDRELYAVLPEGYTPCAGGVAVTIEQCEQFIRCRHDPATEYVSPQRRIEDLELEVDRLRLVVSGYEKASVLTAAGMESVCEDRDKMKHQLRAMERKMTDSENDPTLASTDSGNISKST